MAERGYGLKDFRFSGSYASRYMNCHGSAVLTETFPGFSAKETNKVDTTPSGAIKAHVYGTRIHSVFEDILLETEDWIESAALLDTLAAVRGKAREDLLTNEKEYITWWFLANNNLPPVEYETINKLYISIPQQEYYDDLADETIIVPPVAASATPKQIRFIADALRSVFSIMDEREGATFQVEPTIRAEWVATKPNTTADLVITDGKTLDIVDLKIGTIAVPAYENYQLLYYGKTYRTTEERVNVHILQDKHENGIDTWSIPEDYFESWVADALEAEQAILNGSRTTQVGSHCLFCPANPYSKGERGMPVCPTQVEALFGPPDLSVITEED